MPGHSSIDERPRLYDSFDQAGRGWLDEVVDAVNAGGYGEALARVLADERAIHGSDAD